LRAHAVDERAVGAAEILDEEAFLHLEADGDVRAADGGLRDYGVGAAAPADHPPGSVHGQLEALVEALEHTDPCARRHRDVGTDRRRGCAPELAHGSPLGPPFGPTHPAVPSRSADRDPPARDGSHSRKGSESGVAPRGAPYLFFVRADAPF